MRFTLLSLFLIIGLLKCECQMTLNDCLAYAREHAHRNTINRLDAKEASFDARISSSNLMPYISLSTNGNISFGRNIDPETNTYDNKKTLYTGFGLQMSLPVFDGFVNINNLKASRAAHRRKIKTAQAVEDEISLEVVKSFYNVFFCKAMVKQMQELLERDIHNLKQTQEGLRLGTKSGADVSEIEAIVAADKYELTNQTGTLKKAYLELRGAMGMEITDSLELDLVDEYTAPGTDASFEHPLISEARISVEEARYALRAARGAFSPRITLNAGVSTSYYKMLNSNTTPRPFSRQWHDNMGQYVGFSLSLPLFTGLSNFNKLKRAGIELEKRKEQLAQKKFEIDQETATARLELHTAIEEHEAAKVRYDAEIMAFNAINRKYELGGASALDLYTSGANLATARANLEGTRIKKIISRITLGYYNGERL